MSSSDDAGDVAGPTQWESISLWLAQHAQGQEVLAALRSASQPTARETAGQLAVLAQRPDAPPALVAVVTGGYVGKLVQIARAEVVNVLVSASPVPPPAQLPPAPPDFVNRSAELRRLHRALTRGRPDGRIFAVSSQAGIGKSALAVRFAHDVLDDFADAQLYADLRGAEHVPVDPAKVLDSFLRALGVPGEQLPPVVEERQALYRSMMFRRRALVLLDNAASEQQIRLLLPGGPGCLVVTTSRPPLDGLDLAEQIMLHTLSPAHSLELLARMAGRQRIYAEREAAQEVARYCGHLPLALRIAGARLRSRPGWRVRDLADRLADERRRLDELHAGDRDARSSFELSYRELDAQLARAFRLLGLAPGTDFGEQAAAAVLGRGAGEARVLLEGLVDSALLETAAAGRYRFHDLLRLFARELLAAREEKPDQDAALERVLRFYGQESRAWRDRAPGETHPHPAAVAWFDADRVNVLEAAEVAYQRDMWDIVNDLALGLHHLLALQGRATEMERLLSLAVSAGARSGDPRGEIHHLVLLAEFLLWHGRAEETPPMYARALTLSDRLGDPATRCWILVHHGDSYWDLDRMEAARECHEQALGICLAEGDRAREAWVRTHLAITMRGLRRADAALDLFGQALAFSEERRDPGNRAWVLTHMASALDDLARTEEADRALGEALAFMRGNHDLVGQEWVLEHLGTILVGRHAWRTAADVYQQAADVAGIRSDAFAVSKWTGKAAWAASMAASD